MAKKYDQPETRVILDAVRSIVRALRVSSRSCEKACGLSSAQLFVLQQLERGDGISMNDLAERTLTHQSSVSAVVGKLCEKRLVTRLTSESDSRRAEIYLTDAGRAMLRTSPRVPQEELVAAISRMPADKRHQLAWLLTDLVTDAGIADVAPPLFLEEEK